MRWKEETEEEPTLLGEAEMALWGDIHDTTDIGVLVRDLGVNADELGELFREQGRVLEEVVREEHDEFDWRNVAFNLAVWTFLLGMKYEEKIRDIVEAS